MISPALLDQLTPLLVDNPTATDIVKAQEWVSQLGSLDAYAVMTCREMANWINTHRDAINKALRTNEDSI